MSTLTAPRATRVSRTCWFLRHLGEMTVAMLVGMLVYGVLLGSLLTGVGSNLEEGRLDQPELFVLGMAFSMSVPMVALMRRQGHGWRNSVEMSAAMFVPALVIIVCY